MLAQFDEPSSPRLQTLLTQIINTIAVDQQTTISKTNALIQNLQSQFEDSTNKVWLAIWSNWFSALNDLTQTKSTARNEALLKLAIVASEGKAIQPWLSCAAMYRLADELRIDGNIEAASQIIHDAKRSFPSHPIHHKDDFKIRNELK